MSINWEPLMNKLPMHGLVVRALTSQSM